MHDARTSRILAVTIRSDRIGYAAFESSAGLLDFGVSRFPSRAGARTRIQTLFTRFRPITLVLDDGAKSRRQRVWRKSISRIVRRQSRKMSVPVSFISRRELHSFFRQRGKTNKYDRATLAAYWFPDLTRKLPPRPKFYDPEPYAMTAIDAVILGAMYLNLKHQSFETDAT